MYKQIANSINLFLRFLIRVNYIINVESLHNFICLLTIYSVR